MTLINIRTSCYRQYPASFEDVRYCLDGYGYESKDLKQESDNIFISEEDQIMVVGWQHQNCRNSVCSVLLFEQFGNAYFFDSVTDKKWASADIVGQIVQVAQKYGLIENEIVYKLY